MTRSWSGSEMGAVRENRETAQSHLANGLQILMTINPFAQSPEAVEQGLLAAEARLMAALKEMSR